LPRAGVVLSLLSGLAGAQVTIHVPGDIATIQGAVLAANSGDTILVAPGTYLETIDPLGKAIRVASTGGPEVTTIDGQGFRRCLQLVNGEGPATVVEGFRLYRGRGQGLGSSGGGAYVSNASAVIRDCIFDACLTWPGSSGSFPGGMGQAAGNGAGLWIAGGSPWIERCLFRDNACGTGGQGARGVDGEDGLFNPPDDGGTGGVGGAGGNGGGVYVSGGSPTLVGLFFTGNRAGDGGTGGMGGRGGDGHLLQDGGDGGRGGLGGTSGQGGALFVAGGTPRLVNCTVSENSHGMRGTGGSGGAGGLGGSGGSNGSMGFNGSPGNLFPNGGLVAPSSTLVQNSILWANQGTQLFGGAIASSCDVQGGYPGTGNFALDPLLAGMALSDGSPCIDAGNDLWVPAGTETDLAGHARFFDHPFVPSNVPGSTVDLGCTEFVAAFALPYGCGPAGTVSVVSGAASPGATVRFGVDHPDLRLGATAALLVGTARDPAPCGTPVRGGSLLLDLSQPYTVLWGHGTGPQAFDVLVPADPALIGSSLFVQGATLAPRGARPGGATLAPPLAWRLLEAVELIVGP